MNRQLERFRKQRELQQAASEMAVRLEQTGMSPAVASYIARLDMAEFNTRRRLDAIEDGLATILKALQA